MRHHRISILLVAALIATSLAAAAPQENTATPANSAAVSKIVQAGAAGGRPAWNRPCGPSKRRHRYTLRDQGRSIAQNAEFSNTGWPKSEMATSRSCGSLPDWRQANVREQRKYLGAFCSTPSKKA